jgi:hypothetical protein
MTSEALAAWEVCGFIGLLGALVLWKIVDGTIDLRRLISEPNGDASMSRFQLLVFTFVVALTFFVVSMNGGHPHFSDVPASVLSLLGISASSYLVSKGIQFSNPNGVEERPPQVTVSPSTATVRYGQTQAFGSKVILLPSARVSWAVVAGPGTIDTQGVYAAPAAAGGAPTPQHATVRVSSVDDPGISDLAVVTLI